MHIERVGKIMKLKAEVKYCSKILQTQCANMKRQLHVLSMFTLQLWTSCC